MEPVLHSFDIWINGVRADQSDVRKSFGIEQKAKFGVTRFQSAVIRSIRINRTRQHKVNHGFKDHE